MLTYGSFCPFSPIPVTSLLALCWTAHVSPIGLPPHPRCKAGRQPHPYHLLLHKGPEDFVVIAKSSCSLQLSVSYRDTNSNSVYSATIHWYQKLFPFSTRLFAGHNRLPVIMFALNPSRTKFHTCLPSKVLCILECTWQFPSWGLRALKT